MPGEEDPIVPVLQAQTLPSRSPETPLLLAGDLGGTKTFLALAAADKPGELLFERRYQSRHFAAFEPLLRSFLQDAASPPILAAAFAVAGPVADNRCQLTYLPWQMAGASLAEAFGLCRVSLINDFAAAALGIALLAPEALATLQAGKPEAAAPRVVLGAGTGLGVAALLAEPNGGWRALAGEGGHLGLAARDAQDLGLVTFLARKYGRATTERVLSGQGLVDLYEYLWSEAGASETANLLQTSDPAAAISGEALRHPESLAGRALDRFVGTYGAFAGDLALLFMARGGVYLAGGIAPKVLPRLRTGPFLSAFQDKAEHHRLMADFPVHVVLEERLALLGAAQWASDLLDF
ncbi:MAG: glucokinase [Betaproteobacteria bacterium]|nr:glucokinase [Betaproteobacteria bacterium]